MGKDLEPSELPETDDNPDPDLDVALINDVPSIERSVLDNIVIKVEFKNYPSKTERSKPIKVKVSTVQTPFSQWIAIYKRPRHLTADVVLFSVTAI